MLKVDEHPFLDVRAMITEFSKPIGELESSNELLSFLSLEKSAPVFASESVKPKIRDLLRLGGYQPTGRGKPASEYLRQAIEKGNLLPINLAVDACNIVSLHSGLPISVVDLNLVSEPLRIGIAPAESEYVFNATGQSIKLDGLLCLFDSDGPCANGVKDSQRTKTSHPTTRTLSIIWGTNQLAGQTEQTLNWYRSILEDAGAKTKILANA